MQPNHLNLLTRSKIDWITGLMRIGLYTAVYNRAEHDLHGIYCVIFI